MGQPQGRVVDPDLGELCALAGVEFGPALH